MLLDLRDRSNIFIQTSQEQLERQFSALKHRFYKEKKRVGNLLHATRVHCHSYNASLIRLIIGLMIGSAIGPRTVNNVLKTLSEYMDIPTPARSTISQWFSIIGLYIYNLPIKNADDWIWLIDLSIPVGVRKLCIILGVRKSDLQKGHYNVRHRDMTIIGLIHIFDQTPKLLVAFPAPIVVFLCHDVAFSVFLECVRSLLMI